MARMTIIGIKEYEGSYELDIGRPLNGREWRWIKKHSGYLPLTLSEGLSGRDPDLYIALACIAMARDGKIRRDDGLLVADLISETYGVQIDLEPDEEPKEADEVPLDLTPPPVELLRGGSSLSAG